MINARCLVAFVALDAELFFPVKPHGELVRAAHHVVARNTGNIAF